MYINMMREIGFGTTIPRAQYHFAIADFLVGGDDGPQFMISRRDGTLTFANGSTQLFKINDLGTVFARKIQVTMSPFPDYVFEKNYQLRSLKELESYIIVNKHLPGIKSASEYDKEQGVDLGELQIKLLEKVEELTLYILQQQKEIEQLKTQLAKIK